MTSYKIKNHKFIKINDKYGRVEIKKRRSEKWDL
jgi:hypothetical protein